MPPYSCRMEQPTAEIADKPCWMSQVLSSAASAAKGFVYETANGTKRFVAHVAFDDAAVRRTHGDFDGREELKVWFPVQGSDAWRIRKARYSGTDAKRFDIHSFAATIGRKQGVDLASLMEFGFASSASIRGPKLGLEDIEFQNPGQNARVFDVGKVDERGIAWTSAVFTNRSSQRSELEKEATIAFDRNLSFELDVFAPALTPRGGVVLSPEEQKKIIKRLGISVESDFLPRGYRHKLLSYVSNVGPDGNNMRLAWHLSDPANFRNHNAPESGIYPVRIMKGKEVLATFNIDWKKD